MAKRTYYVTTPLYYVNASPHIGHSYTNIAADCLARYHRLRGKDVFLLTGTDEHGQKIERAAAAAGKTPQAFVDEVVGHFQSLWKTLHLSHDEFIRTTEKRHIERVQTAMQRLHDAGRLTRSAYQGWYCTPDETFWTEAELAGVGGTGSKPACPSCGRPLEPVQEEGWHLKLRANQEWLRGYVKDHPQFIRPETRYNELVSLLEQPLPESLFITRPRNRVKWGIPVPFDPDHVFYVWIDALLNYATVPWALHDADPKRELWPPDVQLIGKDILRHHALYWPILLHELGSLLPELGSGEIPLPKTIFAHGWWKIGEQKMSKSLGNIVDPSVVVGQFLKGQPFAADIYRYFVLREVPFGNDGNFSEDAILVRLNADLANDLGNLINRTLSMLDRYSQGTVPAAGQPDSEDDLLHQTAAGLPARIDLAMADLQFSLALEPVMAFIAQANRYIEAQAPWKLSKVGNTARLHTVLHALAEVIRSAAILLEPFMPSVAEEAWRQLGCQGPRRLEDVGHWPSVPEGQRIGPHPVIFPKPGVT